MARKKVKLQLIANDSARRATFNKRRASLMKKTSELATLCDVDACVLVYGAGSSQPEVWPPSATEAARILSRFKAMPEVDQCKRMMDMEDFLRQRNAKLKEQLEKASKENHKRETALLLHNAITGRGPSVAALSRDELISLESTVNTRLKEVMNAIQRLKEQCHGDPATALQLSMASQPQVPPAVPYTAGSDFSEAVPAPDLESWLLDLTKDEGFGGDSGSFGGGVAGASTSGGLGDMLQLGNTMARLPEADQKPSFAFPPPM